MIIEATILGLITMIVSSLLWFVYNLGGGLRQKKAKTLAKANEHIIKLDTKVQSNDLEVLKSVMIDTDKLFDYVLVQMNFKGTTMADRLNDSINYFTKDEFNQIWNAHKSRNILVHEIEYKIKADEIKRNYNVLKSAIYKILR